MKKILITGSTKGLGLIIANEIGKKNKIALNSRKKIKKKKWTFPIAVGDMSNEKQSKNVLKKAVKALGSLDVLICNAGQSKSAVTGKENITHWKKSFNNNFFCAVNSIKAAIPYLRKTRGSIICISSICGIEYINGAPITYSTSKAALNFYVKNYSKYLAKHEININLISPGNIMFKNSLWERKLKKNKNKTLNYIKSNVPMNKFGNPDLIIDVINLLIKKDSKFITGSNIVLDGGQTIS